MLFFQVTVQLGWVKNWRKGDVKAAFLRGRDRDVDKDGRLYLLPPKDRPLTGVPFGCLFKLSKVSTDYRMHPGLGGKKSRDILGNVDFNHVALTQRFLFITIQMAA